MPSSTDILNLNKLDIFQTLRKQLENDGSTFISNLLAYKDQILYLWNSEECCLYSILLSTVHEERPLYQVRCTNINNNFAADYFLQVSAVAMIC